MQMTWVPLVSGMQHVYFIWHSFSAAMPLGSFRTLLSVEFHQNAQYCLLVWDSNPSQCIRQEVWYLQLFLWVLYMTMSVSCNKSPAVTHGKLKGHCCTNTLNYQKVQLRLMVLTFRLLSVLHPRKKSRKPTNPMQKPKEKHKHFSSNICWLFALAKFGTFFLVCKE